MNIYVYDRRLTINHYLIHNTRWITQCNNAANTAHASKKAQNTELPIDMDFLAELLVNASRKLKHRHKLRIPTGKKFKFTGKTITFK